MKLYMHPVSMTSRPINLMIADNDLEVETQVVDLMTGEHHQPTFTAINPNKLVPVLEDGDFRLTESSAILKYLADKFELAVYPKDLQKRAKVNEMMDWFNTQFYREFGYGLNYPQIFPHHKRPSDEVQNGTVAWAKNNVEGWLQILDTHWIGPDAVWLCNGEKSIADYFGACLITLGDVTRCDFSGYPNVTRWLDNVKSLPSWGAVNEALYGLAEAVKDQTFTVVGR